MRLPMLRVVVEGTRTVRGEFDLEVAYSEEECRRGLMFRQSIGEGEGLLMRNPGHGAMSIWMRDTSLPLDAVFIGPDWRIRTVVEDMRPFSECAHVSNGDAVAAIEFVAGTIRRAGIEIGDAVFKVEVPPMEKDVTGEPSAGGQRHPCEVAEH
jgi:uncharacterized membrane protein (UPF0127 family)